MHYDSARILVGLLTGAKAAPCTTPLQGSTDISAQNNFHDHISQ